MLSLLDPRIWAVFIIACALSYGAGWLKRGSHDRLEQQAAIAKANLDTFKRSEHLQRNADEASTLAAAAAIHDRNRARRADGDVERMRDTLDAVERAAAASGDASGKYAAALGADLRACVSEYRSLGEDAAGHARDSLMYQQAWPK